MKNNKLLVIFLIVIGLWSCKEEPKSFEDSNEKTVSTFYFIRHAEKDRSFSDNKDPELTQEGLGRAMRWAEVFDYIPLDAIYTTDRERTSMTAAPTSIKKDITVQFYEFNEVNMEQFKNDYLGQNVLIVGHSNTTPDFVNKMIGEEKYDGLDDYDNSTLFIVQIINNKITAIRLKID
ncbi:MAG: phosphoglycerate mutase family protein [Cellulophaga sp.]